MLAPAAAGVTTGVMGVEGVLAVAAALAERAIPRLDGVGCDSKVERG